MGNNRSLRVAVEGCGHGKLDSIYASIDKTCEINGWPGIDILIIGGDFQAVRNAYDLNCMSAPMKYREMGDFHEYYSGARKAPYLTIFVGGNHEASNHLWELYYGGWVAPNIFYVGAANVIRVGPLRIAGLSGIWKGYNYRKPHYERLPYSSHDVKSTYHVRELDVRKLLQLRTQVDVGISHDWPQGVEWKGDYRDLFRKKSLFEADAREGQLGSIAAKQVLERLRPSYWFSAHLHIKYSAVVNHGNVLRQPKGAPPAPQESSNKVFLRNEDEIDLDMMDDDEPNQPTIPEKFQIISDPDEIELALNEGNSVKNVNADQKKDASVGSDIPEEIRARLPESFAYPLNPDSAVTPRQQPQSPPLDITNDITRFLALDKCLPRRNFLQILEIASISEGSPNGESPVQLEYDKEWLAITRVFANELQLGDPDARVPPLKDEATYRSLIIEQEEWIEQNVVKSGKMVIPQNFELTAPVYDPTQVPKVSQQPREYNNPQTKAFCELLQIKNAFDSSEEDIAARLKAGPRTEHQRMNNRGGKSFGKGGSRGRQGGGGHRGRGRGRGGSY
ncbi:DBR1-domain-containing protein [Patellaria atrata CBS 101060]|uniref:DBR1-domain-containing protein n=1 Tax=Patellaria atrata CBS 101060 TaxID=1346257 RepID=A0A9P4SI40_9PEZI|nr:DBR1-domain-containing protein [Patellaria atrata CBS 101060]